MLSTEFQGPAPVESWEEEKPAKQTSMLLGWQEATQKSSSRKSRKDVLIKRYGIINFVKVAERMNKNIHLHKKRKLLWKH